MRQRNDTGSPLFAATDPPQTVGVGEVIDYPGYVIGLTVLDGDTPPAEEPPAAEAGHEQPSPARVARRRTEPSQEG